jgi:predicted metal-dependent phosphoesterase TrpH
VTARWKTVIHVHTHYSHDADASPADVVATARRQGVDCIAVTDHNRIDGALEAREIGTVRVIIGEEISSADGHIIGLFLEHAIPPRLPAEETAARIRAQGGVVLAPHPFASLCPSSLGAEAITRLLPWLDAVEICNAQNPFFWEDRHARRFAARHGVPAYAGADAHLRGHLAGCYQWLTPFGDAAGFQAALRAARLVRGHFGWRYYARMAWRHYGGGWLGRRRRVCMGNARAPVASSTE